MTTIACNREGMASDSFTGDGNPARKIHRGPGILLGIAGDIYFGQLLAQWVIKGMRGKPPEWNEDYNLEEKQNAADTTLLILEQDGIFTMDGRGCKVPVDKAYAAIGSGAPIAQGALYWGHSPQEAVEAACAHNGESKLPVIYEPFTPKARHPRRNSR